VFVFRPMQLAQFKQRAEPIVQVAKRSALLIRAAPWEVHQDFLTNHRGRSAVDNDRERAHTLGAVYQYAFTDSSTHR
jgi:hypothetical protein